MRKFEVVNDIYRKTNGEIILPERADNRSAAYDLRTPIDFSLKPGFTIVIPTDIKVQMEDDEVMSIFVRSSIGIKKHITLCNGTGVIDASFYQNPDNDGNICIALKNDGNEEQYFKAGDRICQCLFVKYLTTDNDNPMSNERKGGVGSSGR